MAETFGKSWVLLFCLRHCCTLMEDYTWKIARNYFNCLPVQNVFATKILMVKIVLLSSFLVYKNK